MLHLDQASYMTTAGVSCDTKGVNIGSMLPPDTAALATLEKESMEEVADLRAAL